MLNLYQTVLTERSNQQSKDQKQIVQITNDIEKLAEFGIPGWQLRWLLKNLKQAGLKISRNFEKSYWPVIRENYFMGPASDLYFGLCAAIFGLDPEQDDLQTSSEKILKRLQREVVQRDQIWGWLNDKEQIDFSLPHGITGVALALSLLEKRLGSHPAIHQLLGQLEKSFQFVLKLGRVESTQVWPPMASQGTGARVGWCRSDLSTGIALIIVAHRTGRNSFAQLGEKFLRRVKRVRPQDLETNNPYLCHGSSGNFYLLNLAFELTGDAWFLEQSRKVDLVTEKYLASEKFPRQASPESYHLTDLENCLLPGRTFHEGLDSGWDLILAFRDPFDQKII